jgi:hypothetical protein
MYTVRVHVVSPSNNLMHRRVNRIYTTENANYVRRRPRGRIRRKPLDYSECFNTGRAIHRSVPRTTTTVYLVYIMCPCNSWCGILTDGERRAIGFKDSISELWRHANLSGNSNNQIHDSNCTGVNAEECAFTTRFIRDGRPDRIIVFLKPPLRAN